MKKFLLVLPWILVLQAFNFGITFILGIIIAAEQLFTGRAGSGVATLINIPLTFLDLFTSPIGIVRILLLLVGVFLFIRARTAKDNSKDVVKDE